MYLMIKQKKLYVITKSNWGGAQKYVFDMAKNDKKSHLEVAVALGGNGELAEKLRAENLPTFKIDGLGRDVNIFKEFIVFVSFLKIYRKYRPKVVHLNSSKVGGLGALVARISGVPKIVYTAHGWVFNESRPRWQILILKFLSWLTILLCHEVWVLSEFEKKQVENWPFARKKILVKPMELEPIDFVDQNEARRFLINLAQKINPDFLLNPDEKLIGSIGELHKNKGYDRAIELLKNSPEKIFGLITENYQILKNWKWIIIGEGEEHKALEKQIKDAGFSDKIILVGKIMGAPYLKAFDLFLFPSRKEGRPYAILEAMAAGLPIVSTKVGGIPEMTKSYKKISFLL